MDDDITSIGHNHGLRDGKSPGPHPYTGYGLMSLNNGYREPNVLTLSFSKVPGTEVGIPFSVLFLTSTIRVFTSLSVILLPLTIVMREDKVFGDYVLHRERKGTETTVPLVNTKQYFWLTIPLVKG